MARAEPSTPKEILSRLQPWVERHRRPAWKPVLRKGDGPVTATKYSGTFWMPPDEEWPTCGACKRPMQPFFQLNLDRLPTAVRGEYGSGLLQLFYCRFSGGMDCPSDGGYEPFSWCQHVRIVKPPARPRPRKPPADLHAFPAKTVVSWKKIDDYPKSGEHEELGLDYDYDFDARTLRVKCTNPRFVSAPVDIDSDIPERLCECYGGDKLGGWPAWIQSSGYPSCPRCEKRMRFVYLFTGDPLGYMFGDVGLAYITQCKRHKKVVAFSWQCH